MKRKRRRRKNNTNNAFYVLLLLTAIIAVIIVTAEEDLQQPLETAKSDEEVIFDFLKAEMGFNTAAACGVLSNIYYESKFDYNQVGDRGTSYGICQWHSSRWEAMRRWCSANGYDSTTLIGQLQYMKFELSKNDQNYLWNGKKVMDYMLSVENTAEGAYDAGYYWCYYYEVPANKDSSSVTRGKTARDTYWRRYNREIE